MNDSFRFRDTLDGDPTVECLGLKFPNEQARREHFLGLLREKLKDPEFHKWGMAIATHPFFGKIAEIIGRLSALQGDCASTEVHRRMMEHYGEREGTRRMTNMVMQSQASWGAILRTDGGKRIIRQSPMAVRNDEFIAWLIEAVLRYSDRALPTAALQFFPRPIPAPTGSALVVCCFLQPSLGCQRGGPLNSAGFSPISAPITDKAREM
ncbi:MAG: hypothetical protein ACREVE_06715 [Gammaproteobacteria bacterium]